MTVAEVSSAIHEFSTLGPALGSVFVIGVICYYLVKLIKNIIEKLLTMFTEHSKALSEIRENMNANTQVMTAQAEMIHKVASNVESNTEVTHHSAKVTEQMSEILTEFLKETKKKKRVSKT